jgi:hypothetical protein
MKKLIGIGGAALGGCCAMAETALKKMIPGT